MPPSLVPEKKENSGSSQEVPAGRKASPRAGCGVRAEAQPGSPLQGWQGQGQQGWQGQGRSLEDANAPIPQVLSPR